MPCTNRLNWKPLLPYVAIAFATVLVWGQSVFFGFVWDDRHFIRGLNSIRSLKHIPEMFYSLAAQSSLPDGFLLFRPLRTAHYAVLYWLGGQTEPQPWLFHSANLLWHGAAAMLLFSVMARLLQRLAPNIALDRCRWLALWVALGFAVHPVVSEVVCWAKSLDDAMAAVFTLASLRALLGGNGDRKSYLWALLWFLLAVYSKISAVPFALLVFFVFFRILNLSLRRSIQLSGGFLLVAAVFMVHRHLVIGRSSQTEPISGTYLQTLIDMFPVAPKYLRLLWGMPPFCIDYTYLPGHHPFFSVPVFLGLILLCGAAALCLWAFRRPEHTLAAFGLLWIAAFMLPVSNILPMMQYMAERFLYLPLIGWLCVLVWLWIRGTRWQLSAGIAGVMLVVWGAVAWDRSWIWRDEITLFVQSSQQGLKIDRVKENAIIMIFELPHIRTLFKLDPATRTFQFIGQAPPPEKQARVLRTLEEAQRLFPDDPQVASALGFIHSASGATAKALPFFRAAVQGSPKNAKYWSNLGIACLELEDLPEAEQALQKALALDANNIEALKTYAALCWRQEKYPLALESFEKLHKLEPANPQHADWIQKARDHLAGSGSALEH